MAVAAFVAKKINQQRKSAGITKRRHELTLARINNPEPPAQPNRTPSAAHRRQLGLPAERSGGVLQSLANNLPPKRKKDEDEI